MAKEPLVSIAFSSGDLGQSKQQTDYGCDKPSLFKGGLLHF